MTILPIVILLIAICISLYIIMTLYEEWKAGFKVKVLIVLTILIPTIVVAVGMVIDLIYK